MFAGNGWRRLKRVGSGLLLVVGVASLGVGAYMLYLAHEIATVERRVVVPLPTDDPHDLSANVVTATQSGPTPTPLAPNTPTPTHVPATTVAAAVTLSPPSPPPPSAAPTEIPRPPPAPTATAIPPSPPPPAPTATPMPPPPAPLMSPPASALPPMPPAPPATDRGVGPLPVANTPMPQPAAKPPPPMQPPPVPPTATRVANVTVVPLSPVPTAPATPTATQVTFIIPLVPVTPVPRAAISGTPLAQLPRIPTATPITLATNTPAPPPSPPSPPSPQPAPTAPPAPPSPMPMPKPAIAPTAPLPTVPSATGILRGGIGAVTDPVAGHEPVWGGKQYVHILLMGLDRRDTEPARSDTMILATVNLWDGAVSLLSIPRDLMAPIPGYGEDRINAAFAYGQAAHPNDPAAGPALAVKTVSRQFNVPIEHYLFVDFNGYKEIVDAVGGVEIAVPNVIDDWQYPTDDYGVMHVHFDPGTQHMNGDRALIYARTRHMSDDNERRERQMQVMQAVLLRALQIDSVHKLQDIVKRLGNTMQTSLPYEAQISLIKLGRKIQDNGVAQYSIKPPMVRPYITSAGAAVYMGDWNAIRPVVAEAIDPKRKAKR